MCAGLLIWGRPQTFVHAIVGQAKELLGAGLQDLLVQADIAQGPPGQ